MGFEHPLSAPPDAGTQEKTPRIHRAVHGVYDKAALQHRLFRPLYLKGHPHCLRMPF